MKSQPHSDEEAVVIARARQGDKSSWEMLMRAHQEPIFCYAYLLLGDPEDAEDVAQETFIKTHRALHRFDIERPLRPWLLKIVTNQASNRRRALGRYWGALRRFARQEPAVIGVGISLDEDKAVLWEAIQTLDLSDRQVIYLRYFLQLKVEETAHSLGIPQGTVKSRSSRALRRLKNLIESDYPDLLPG